MTPCILCQGPRPRRITTCEPCQGLGPVDRFQLAARRVEKLVFAPQGDLLPVAQLLAREGLKIINEFAKQGTAQSVADSKVLNAVHAKARAQGMREAVQWLRDRDRDERSGPICEALADELEKLARAS